MVATLFIKKTKGGLLLQYEKNIRSVISVFLSALLLFSFFSLNTFAVYLRTDYNGLTIYGEWTPRLTVGTSNINYYIGLSPIAAIYTTNARLGVESWESSVHDIIMNETTYYFSSVLDIRYYTISSENSEFYRFNEANGVTRLWVGDGITADNNVGYFDADDIPENSHYFAAEVFLNADRISLAHNIQSTTAHEVGHALGLGHVVSTNRLMYPYYTERTAHAPTPTELDAVETLYS